MSELTIFRAELLTQHITYCMSSACPLAETCLHHLAYWHAAPFGAELFFDPRRSEAKLGEACQYYLRSEVVRLGRGFRGALAEVRHGDSQAIRSVLMEELGWGRNAYYERASGKRTLTPDQQERVVAIFKAFGVERKEFFDAYEEGYVL